MIKVNLSDDHGHIVEIDENGRIPVKLPGQQSVVPENANSQTHSFETFKILNKGQANNFIYRPVFQNENSAYNKDLVTTLSGSATSYLLQIFRASSDNVNSVAITTNAVPEGALEDSFSTGWTSSSPSKITISYDSTIYNNTTLDTTSSSTKLTLGNNITGVTVYKTISSNWSNKNSFSLWFRASTLLTFYAKLSDGVNFSTWNFNNTVTNNFQQRIFDINKPDSISGLLNTSAITNITLGITTGGNFTGQYAWFDAFESQTAPSPLYLQLYEFDTNINPNNLSLGTLLTLDDGNTEIQVTNSIIKTTQRVHLLYGVTNIDNKLKNGNYYGLVWYNGGIGTHNIYGNSTEKIYQNGTVHTAPLSGGSLTAISGSPYFTIFAYRDCYIRTIYNTTDKNPEHAKVITIIYSTFDNKRKATLQNNMEFHEGQYIILDFEDIPRYINSDDWIAINYTDDINSAASEFQFGIDAVYEDFKVWG